VLSGITNDELDISVDVLKTVTFPLLLNFNIWGITMKIRRRGARPKGGGEVELLIPPVRGALNPLHVTDEGLVKRVRGTVFSTKVSPQIANRVVTSCREVGPHICHYAIMPLCHMPLCHIPPPIKPIPIPSLY
jgi:RNA 3'-terminal phosphate cyclase-like protein